MWPRSSRQVWAQVEPDLSQAPCHRTCAALMYNQDNSMQEPGRTQRRAAGAGGQPSRATSSGSSPSPPRGGSPTGPNDRAAAKNKSSCLREVRQACQSVAISGDQSASDSTNMLSHLTCCCAYARLSCFDFLGDGRGRAFACAPEPFLCTCAGQGLGASSAFAMPPVLAADRW